MTNKKHNELFKLHLALLIDALEKVEASGTKEARVMINGCYYSCTNVGKAIAKLRKVHVVNYDLPNRVPYDFRTVSEFQQMGY
jgi:hypothetical protein